MDAEEIKARIPLVDFLRGKGVAIKGSGNELSSNECPRAKHKKDHWCVSINQQNQIFHCNDCESSGSIIDWVMDEHNCSFNQAMEILDPGGRNGEVKQSSPPPDKVASAHYDYTDENGQLLFQVVRYIPKTFRQRHKGPNGDWVWSMENVRRVLYHLQEVVAAESVIITEGEKDADNLRSLGFVTTCNVGGAKKWMDSYTETLVGKNVWIWPDNDTAGQAHADMVIKSLTGKVKFMALISVPDKDASDFIGLDPSTAKTRVDEAISKSKPINPLDDIPIKSFVEMEQDYFEQIRFGDENSLVLSKWLPSLRVIRPILPGEMVAIMSSTGVGKTAIIQNIALKSAAPLPTLIFELELPVALMYERFLQIDLGMSGDDIYRTYREFSERKQTLEHSPRTSHIYSCTKAKVTVKDLEGIIEKSELKIGRRPAVVIIDYIGLLGNSGASRYERMSDTAESLKQIARNTNTVIVFATQISRKPNGVSSDVTLSDGKDSGSIENSSGLVIGAWREGGSGEVLKLRVLKNTKGKANNFTIDCNFDGPTLRITEMGKIDKQDVPDLPRNRQTELPSYDSD